MSGKVELGKAAICTPSPTALTTPEPFQAADEAGPDCLAGTQQHSERGVDTGGETVRLAFRVRPFCESIGIGRTKFYELVRDGKIRTVIIGGRRLVPVDEAQRLLREGCK